MHTSQWVQALSETVDRVVTVSSRFVLDKDLTSGKPVEDGGEIKPMSLTRETVKDELQYGEIEPVSLTGMAGLTPRTRDDRSPTTRRPNATISEPEHCPMHQTPRVERTSEVTGSTQVSQIHSDGPAGGPALTRAEFLAHLQAEIARKKEEKANNDSPEKGRAPPR